MIFTDMINNFLVESIPQVYHLICTESILEYFRNIQVSELILTIVPLDADEPRYFLPSRSRT